MTNPYGRVPLIVRNLTQKDCYLQREELGNASWRLLHGLAQHYPQQPSQEEQRLMKELLHGIIHLYPCLLCRQHAIPMLQRWWKPESASSRSALQRLICGMHNEVNVSRKGKPTYSCDCDGGAEVEVDFSPDRERLQGRNLVLERISLRELGQVFWLLLHALVEMYGAVDDSIEVPPPESQQQQLQQVVAGLFYFFPQGEAHWKERAVQPDTSAYLPIPQQVLQEGRVSAMRWACKLHNAYNLALGEGKMPCLAGVGE